MSVASSVTQRLGPWVVSVPGAAQLVTIVCRGCSAALHYPLELLRDRRNVRCAGCENETPVDTIQFLVPLDRLEAVLPLVPESAAPWDAGRFSEFPHARRP